MAGHHAVAEILLVGEAEVAGAVGDEPVELHERARVEQRIEPLTRRQLALVVLGLDAVGAAAELGLGALLLEELEFLSHGHTSQIYSSPARLARHHGRGIMGPRLPPERAIPDVVQQLAVPVRLPAG